MTFSPIVLCPGQGAQSVGMGRAWRDADPAAAEVFVAADEILGDSLGIRLSTLCFEGPPDRLNRTDVSQPAIYACSVACARALARRFGELAPQATAGLSLGEYTALHLAGVFSFEAGLRLVAQRGRFMQEAAAESRGGMVALIGADESQADQICRAAKGDEVLVPANYNAPGQIVLSGSAGACERAASAAESAGVKATPLTVAGAFHSPLMQPAALRLQAALEVVHFAEPACPVVSNVTALPHEAGHPNRIKLRLVEQLTAPVRWSQSCHWLIANMKGEYHEVAPGKVLMGLMRRVDRNTRVTNHDTPA